MRKKMWFFLFFAVLVSCGMFAQDYSLTVPQGWVKNEAAVTPQYQNGTSTFILTIDRMPSDANTPDKYIEFIKGKLKGTFKDITFISVQKGKKENFETRELIYTVAMYGMTLKYHVLYVFRSDKAYTLTIANLEKSITDAYLKEVEAIFTTFKLK